MKVQMFRKKPVVIEALQFHGDIAPFMGWAWEASKKGGAAWSLAFTDDGGPLMVIPTLEGDMRASPGDWVIKGVAGEFYPCKPDIFEATYEAVSK